MASGVSPQNRPLTYSYSASAGSISGNTSTATLSTAGVAPGTITVTCNVVDDKGQTASQQTTVTVTAPAAPPAVTTTSLCTINFDRDKARPTRVDNEAKACLDDIALTAQRQADAKLAITGNSDPSAKKAEKLAAERAVNEKAYLVGEKGLDASRISVYTGTAGTNTAATTLIPAGATLDTTGLTPVDESAVKAISGTAPAHHHKK
jgi:outer membrane protein OmpA-like peptidoglycan-associated protein